MLAVGYRVNSKKAIAFKLNKALVELKQNLISKNAATDTFGVERTRDSIAGIIGNVMQSFGGKELYPSIEEIQLRDYF